VKTEHERIGDAKLNSKEREKPAKSGFQFAEHPWISLLATLMAVITVFLLVVVLGTLAGIPGDSPYRLLLLPTLSHLIVLFLIVPFGLRLPYGKRSLREYLDDIRLSNVNPFFPLFVLGVSCALFLLMSSTLTSIAYRLAEGLPTTRSFLCELINLAANLPPDSPSYIVSFPAIFEEVLWRGAMLRLFRRMYTERQTILITALGFGLLHLFNLVGGFDPAFVILQVLWSSALGFFYGYLVFRVDSLLPAMLFHYLVNMFIGSFGGYLQRQASTDVAMLYSFISVCIVVPLLILWVKFFSSRWLSDPSTRQAGIPIRAAYSRETRGDIQ
jgi:membrane protease YdiL (CAAX protease family)